MYIRPQLSRHRTGDREILSNEHNADVSSYKDTLSVGEKFEADIEKIANFIDELSKNSTLYEPEKQPVLQQLKAILSELEKEHSTEVGEELANIEFSIKERIDEIEAATRKQESEVFHTESSLWSTDAVDKDKLVAVSRDLLDKYNVLLDKTKMDLNQLMKEADEQRLRIKERMRKR